MADRIRFKFENSFIIIYLYKLQKGLLDISAVSANARAPLLLWGASFLFAFLSYDSDSVDNCVECNVLPLLFSRKVSIGLEFFVFRKRSKMWVEIGPLCGWRY